MIRLSSAPLEWGFVSGRVNVREGRLLSPEFLVSLVSHANVEDLLRHLQETPLKEALLPGAAFSDWSAIIDGLVHEQVVSLRENCPDTRVADLFLLQGDYQNLKRALTGEGEFPFAGGLLSEAVLIQAGSGDLGALPAPFKETARGVIAAMQDPAKSGMTDWILDGSYLRHALKLADELEAAFISKVMGEYVMVRAIVMLWRGMRSGASIQPYYEWVLPLGDVTATLKELAGTSDPANWAETLPGPLGDRMREAAGDEDPAQRFEQLCMEYLDGLARQGRGQVYGPERVFSYLWGLFTEAYNLKLIVCGRLSRIGVPVLKRRMRVAHG